MGPRLNLLLIVAVIAVIVIRMSVFTVDTREHAVKFQVGRIVRSDYEPGLHFKIPFFENVARYPKTILNYDEDTEERFLTGEKKKPWTVKTAQLIVPAELVEGAHAEATKRAMARGQTIAQAVQLARDLINEPAAYATPSHMAQTAEKLAMDHGLAI